MIARSPTKTDIAIIERLIVIGEGTIKNIQQRIVELKRQRENPDYKPHWKEIDRSIACAYIALKNTEQRIKEREDFLIENGAPGWVST